MKDMGSKEFMMRAHAWSGRGVEEVRVRVDPDGRVLAWDEIAGHYTACHSLGKSAISRARKIAGK